MASSSIDIPNADVMNVMEPLSELNVNDRIISLPSLKCIICQEIPNSSMIMNDKYGILCNKCYKPDKHPNAVPNTALEEIFKQLKFPCYYSSNGCTRKLSEEELVQHKITCIYRNYTCPVSIYSDCTGNGTFTDLQQHFEKYHADLIFKHNSSVTINVNIERSNGFVTLLLVNDETFLLQVICNAELNKVWYILYYIGEQDKALNYHYVIKPLENDSIGFQGKCNEFTDCDAIKKNFTFEANVISTMQVVEIDVSVIKQIIRDVQKNFTIKLSVEGTESTKPNENLLTFFECPVCNNYMRPPIYQCLSGHSLCGECRPRLAHCPTCRTSFGNTRNYSLESMTNNFCYPCIYHHYGCKKTATIENLINHEKECTVKPYNCPLKMYNCRWKGNQDVIEMHLQSEHNEKLHYTNFFQTTMHFFLDQPYDDMFCMITMGQIFRVCYRRNAGNQNSYWTVQVVGPKKGLRQYKYEVGIKNLQNVHNKIKHIDMCQTLMNEENMFDRCIIIPLSFISRFASNGQVKFYIKISEIN